MKKSSPALSGNRLLARLPLKDFQSLNRHLQLTPLEFEQVLYEAHAPLDYAYFPVKGVLSAITIMENGDGIEVATVGNEGMLGLPTFVEAGASPYRVIVQAEGSAYRISASALADMVNRNTAFRRLMSLYQSAFLAQVSQCVACNGLHTVVKRCCRWLLTTHDRLEADELPLTHEFLAMMLGVRRPSVTDVLKQLVKKGLIRHGWGKITVLDLKGLERAACECYRAVNQEFARIFGR